MLNAIGSAIAAILVVASSEPSMHVLAGLEIYRRSAVRIRIIPIVALCAAFGLTAATARAQEFSIDNSDSTATNASSERWASDTGEPGEAPHLVMSMADLTHFQVPDPIRTPAMSRANSYRAAELTDNSIPNLSRLGVTPHVQGADSGFFGQGASLPPESVFTVVEANDWSWESRFADTRTLTDVNGTSICPLLQIDYADVHFPVTLFGTSLRGSDAR